MTEREFALLRDFIQARFGLLFPAENAYLLERRLQPRLEALGLLSFLDYHDFLSNPALPESERARELDEVFDRIATRETYFFRESYQLDALANHLLPALAQKRPRKTRLALWSAGCASGEEVYSLAMRIIESGHLSGWDVDVLGSDWSLQALASAHKGVYGPSSFRQTEAHRQERFFRKTQSGWEIAQEVRRLCRFARVNLVSSDWSAVGGPFDAIFCRNVIIYFDRAARAPLVSRLAEQLCPGGILFLGHSESLNELRTPLQLGRLGGEIVYIKPVS